MSEETKQRFLTIFANVPNNTIVARNKSNILTMGWLKANLDDDTKNLVYDLLRTHSEFLKRKALNKTIELCSL